MFLTSDMRTKQVALLHVHASYKALHSAYVCLCRCVQITNQGVSSLTRLKALQSLDLSDCNNLGDPGLQALLRGLPLLHTLALQHCTHITDAGHAPLPFLSLPLPV